MIRTIQHYSVLATVLFSTTGLAVENEAGYMLEEVIVTAQKREQSLQETPIAISVLTAAQLQSQGILGLTDLMDGTVSSLQVRPFPDDPGVLSLAIRGNGPGDVVQITREGSVAVYLDDNYLGRTQGLYADLADLERIEVLRGPQGTLFGRNATGGAVSMVSKKPQGEFAIKQTLGMGRFDDFRSVSHIDLPEVAGVRTKLSYVHSERDGWVDNTASGEWDYNAYDKDSARLALLWAIDDRSTLEYSYNRADVKASQMYMQLEDLEGAFGGADDKPGRQTKTRYPIAPLDPTVSKHDGHSLTYTVNLNESISFKSLTSYSNLDHKMRNNYGGAIYYNGVMGLGDIDQNQKSQEFRLVGDYDRLEFVAGLYYYSEKASENFQKYFSLDITGDITGTPLSLITPPTTFDIFFGLDSPLRRIESDLTSTALYGQATWTPALLDDHLKLTLGLRHTRDDKSGAMTEAGNSGDFDLDYSHTNPAFTVSYNVNENLLAYAKWGTAFRGGGINLFASFTGDLLPHEEEEVKTAEIGIKSEFWDRRARLNLAVFQTDYIDMILDMLDPSEIQYTESINAEKKVEVNGAEFELTLIPIDGLTLGLGYTYLDGDMPLQPNPLDNGALVKFRLTQTPKHAGSLTLDYRFPSWSIGTLMAHVNITSTDGYHYFPTVSDITDAYTLMGARLTLADIPVAAKGRLSASLWGQNITDEEYATFALTLGVANAVAYGDPRTFGLDISYQY